MSCPIIICEDNIDQLNKVSHIIENYIQFHTELMNDILKTTAPVEVLDYLEKFNVQDGIYFLDIGLHSYIDGIELAYRIRQIDVSAKIVFVTSHDELAPLTFKRKVEAIGYIVKDQSYDSFRKEIQDILRVSNERIIEMKSVINKEKIFTFSFGNKIYNIELSDVILIETSNISHKLDLYAKTSKFEFYGKISEISKSYPDMIRISRACLINRNSVFEVDFNNNKIILDEGLIRYFSPLSKRKLKNLLKR
ncbi:LytR/AlgR family response regulator transcription factor [Companilactobacillus hulinensis]|uniref:LytR/AlgR family response regulator transcription factor n=1 Tax=Companilactobacillus hulinensis TaxID=2486007 RepID=UPI000F7B19E7|nr:LytTR family DNA-binding domain-containing protein [Companilactobacillus hulinensis]